MTRETPWRRVFFIQIRVIYALFLREVITRYGRHNIGFFWMIGEPMLFTAGIATVWSLGSSIHGHSIGVLEFAVTGYSSVLLWRNCANRAVNALQPNLSLLYHRRVRILDIYISRSLLEIVGATASFSGIAASMTFLGYMTPPYDLGNTLFAWFMLCWTALSLGLVIAPVSEMSEMVERIWHVAVYLFFPLSGAMFMVSWLNPTMQKIVGYIPMVNGLEMLRGAYYGPSVRAIYDLPYTISCCMIMTWIGLVLVHRQARTVAG